MKFKPLMVAIYTGVLLAICHAIWSLLVYLGSAKAVLDFVFGLHMIVNPYRIKPFSFSVATNLVVFVFVVGFVVGYLATIIWNMMQKRK